MSRLIIGGENTGMGDILQAGNEMRARMAMQAQQIAQQQAEASMRMQVASQENSIRQQQSMQDNEWRKQQFAQEMAYKQQQAQAMMAQQAWENRLNADKFSSAQQQWGDTLKWKQQEANENQQIRKDNQTAMDRARTESAKLKQQQIEEVAQKEQSDRLKQERDAQLSQISDGIKNRLTTIDSAKSTGNIAPQSLEALYKEVDQLRRQAYVTNKKYSVDTNKGTAKEAATEMLASNPFDQAIGMNKFYLGGAPTSSAAEIDVRRQALDTTRQNYEEAQNIKREAANLKLEEADRKSLDSWYKNNGDVIATADPKDLEKMIDENKTIPDRFREDVKVAVKDKTPLKRGMKEMEDQFKLLKSKGGDVAAEAFMNKEALTEYLNSSDTSKTLRAQIAAAQRNPLSTEDVGDLTRRLKVVSGIESMLHTGRARSEEFTRIYARQLRDNLDSIVEKINSKQYDGDFSALKKRQDEEEQARNINKMNEKTFSNYYEAEFSRKYPGRTLTGVHSIADAIRFRDSSNDFFVPGQTFKMARYNELVPGIRRQLAIDNVPVNKRKEIEIAYAKNKIPDEPSLVDEIETYYGRIPSIPFTGFMERK